MSVIDFISTWRTPIMVAILVIFSVRNLFFSANPCDLIPSNNEVELVGGELLHNNSVVLTRGSIPLIREIPSAEELGKYFSHDHKPSEFNVITFSTPLTSVVNKVTCGEKQPTLPTYMVLSNGGGGYTNQLLSLLIQAAVAEVYNLKIVLGNYTERRGYEGGYSDAKFVQMPLSAVLSFDKKTPVLRDRLIQRQVVGPTPSCGFGKRLADLHEIDCGTIPEGCTVGSNFDAFKIPIHKIVSFLTGIKIVSKKVRSRCSHAKKKIRPFTCWHPRNEKDWGEAYNFSKVDFGLTNKYIVSGVKRAHPIGKSYFKDDFDMSDFSATELLQFDFCVCADADQFVGVLSSTFSYYIWIVRLAKNRLKNQILTNNGVFWSSSMHELYVTGIAGFFNVFLSEQIVIL